MTDCLSAVRTLPGVVFQGFPAEAFGFASARTDRESRQRRKSMKEISEAIHKAYSTKTQLSERANNPTAN